MGLKKNSKISAEFNMSSLTDIIFLLLIFFMLTSNLVAPNALNLKLPGASSPSTSTSKPKDVSITKDGKFYLDGRKITTSNLEKGMRLIAKGGGRKGANVTISPAKGAPVEKVVAVMDMAMRYRINAILLTEDD